MKWGERKSPFGNIPMEILLPIMESLPLGSKLNARLVCRRWHWAVDDDKRLIFRPTVTNKNLINFQRSVKEMDRVTFCLVKSVKPTEDYPEIPNAILGLGNSSSAIIQFMKYICCNSGSLRINSLAFADVNQIKLTKLLAAQPGWTFLKKLEIFVKLNGRKYNIAANSQSHLEAVQIFLNSSYFELLKEVGFHFFLPPFLVEDSIESQHSLLTSFYIFLTKHSNTLRNLSFSIRNKRSYLFELHPLYPPPNLTLDSCAINFSKLRGQPGLRLDLEDMIGTGNKTLDLTLVFPWVSVINVPILIHRNCQTLKHLKLCTSHIYITWLWECNGLESLELQAEEIICAINWIFPKLKSFVLGPVSSLHSGKVLNLPFGLERVLRIWGDEFESFKISGPITTGYVFLAGLLWNTFSLHDYGTNLKSLESKAGVCRDMFSSPHLYICFPALIEFSIYVEEDQRFRQSTIAAWMETNMPNLQVFRLYGSVTAPMFEILRNMKKLKKIYTTKLGFDTEKFFRHSMIPPKIVQESLWTCIDISKGLRGSGDY